MRRLNNQTLNTPHPKDSPLDKGLLEVVDLDLTVHDWPHDLQDTTTSSLLPVPNRRPSGPNNQNPAAAFPASTPLRLPNVSVDPQNLHSVAMRFIPHRSVLGLFEFKITLRDKLRHGKSNN
jgi:hypothetical protein